MIEEDVEEQVPAPGPWRAVDLDGTLAHYDEWRGLDHVGEPVPRMLERVRDWLIAGHDVRILTARVAVNAHQSPAQAYAARRAIEAWCEQHLGRRLPVTATKDMGMVELWDDRAVQVIPNTGARVDGAP